MDWLGYFTAELFFETRRKKQPKLLNLKASPQQAGLILIL
jgi:hypothetical protein